MLLTQSFIVQKLYHYAILMRLHRPIGIWLLLWPTLMALCLAGGRQVQPYLIVVFVLGVIIMRSAGCVVNDYADRDYDGHVERTKERPLVRGKVSPKEALVLLFTLLFIAFLLVCTTNAITVGLSLGGALLACCYPFAKRVTHFPQVVLGAAYGWSIPMAYAASGHDLSVDCWILYGSSLVWAVAYDSLYAMVDYEDDKKIGVKSTAIAFGHFTGLLVGVSHLLMLVLLVILGNILQLNGYFFAGILLASGFALYQQWLIRNQDPKACFQAFLNNQWLGAALFAGTLLAVSY